MQPRAQVLVVGTFLASVEKLRKPLQNKCMPNAHPVIVHALPAIQNAWSMLWKTRVGGTIPLSAVRLDAQVVGKLYERLLEMSLKELDSSWRAGTSKDEKDFVYEKDPAMSFELKMCGQRGSRQVFGNRCSSRGFVSTHSQKKRDGYMLTINFYDTHLNLVRFGWVDGDDWVGQVAASGNRAHLKPSVYTSKLRVLHGDYQREAHAQIIRGVGPSSPLLHVRELPDSPAVQEFYLSEFYV